MSETLRLRHLMLRFSGGTAAGIGLGLVAFRGRVFDPTHPFSQVITFGSLLAAMIALQRARSAGVAWLVAIAFTAWQGVGALGGGARAVGHVLFVAAVVCGLVLLSWIFAAAHEAGFRLGKFLLMGPAVAGVYFAATPALSLGPIPSGNVYRDVLGNLFLGIVIGDGVAFGAEMVDLWIERGSAGRTPEVP